MKSAKAPFFRIKFCKEETLLRTAIIYTNSSSAANSHVFSQKSERKGSEEKKNKPERVFGLQVRFRELDILFRNFWEIFLGNFSEEFLEEFF